jgi:hypothetical protein
MAERREWNAQAVARIVRAEGRRVASNGTEMDLQDLIAVRGTLEESIRLAVHGLVERGTTWTIIGEALGVTRSAAFQRYAPKKQEGAA